VGGCAAYCGDAARRTTVPNFFDLIPLHDGVPDEPLLEPYDEQEVDDLFDQLEQGDDDDDDDDDEA
jgi:hypothetical protein